MDTSRLNASRIKQRKVDELLGICAGVAADGVVNQEEARFIAAWLEANREAATCFPGDVLVSRLRDMLVDGTLDAEESAELLQMLRQSSGQAGTVEVPAPALPQFCDDPAPPVVFQDKSFVMTGIFAYGPREACEQATQARGGITLRHVVEATAYVVIGSAANPQWKHASFGTKIEQARTLKEAGHPVAIISEDHWAEAVVATPELPTGEVLSEVAASKRTLSGKRFLFTGTLSGVSRETAQGMVERLGGVVVSSVSKKLSYLVSGYDPGTKFGKAVSLGIEILDRDAFLHLVGRDKTTINPSKNQETEEDWYVEPLLRNESQPEAKETEQPVQIVEIPGIAGKHFTFTGYLHGISRYEAERRVQQAGGIVEYNVTKSRTDYVVANNISRTELNRATKWGKPIIGGKQLLEMLKGKS